MESVGLGIMDSSHKKTLQELDGLVSQQLNDFWNDNTNSNTNVKGKSNASLSSLSTADNLILPKTPIHNRSGNNNNNHNTSSSGGSFNIAPNTIPINRKQNFNNSSLNTATNGSYNNDAKKILFDSDFMLASDTIPSDDLFGRELDYNNNGSINNVFNQQSEINSIANSLNICRNVCNKCHKCQCFLGSTGLSLLKLESLALDSQLLSDNDNDIDFKSKASKLRNNQQKLPISEILSTNLASVVNSFSKLFIDSEHDIIYNNNNNNNNNRSFNGNLSPLTPISRTFETNGQFIGDYDYNEFDPDNESKKLERKKQMRKFGFDTTDNDEGASFFKTKFLFLNNANNEQMFSLGSDPILDASLFDIINKRAADSAVSAATRYPQGPSLFTPSNNLSNNLFNSTAFQNFISSLFKSQNNISDPVINKNIYFYHGNKNETGHQEIYKGDVLIDYGKYRCNCSNDYNNKNIPDTQSNEDLIDFSNIKSNHNKQSINLVNNNNNNNGNGNNGLIQVHDLQFSMINNPNKSPSRISSNLFASDLYSESNKSDSNTRKSIISSATEFVAMKKIESINNNNNTTSAGNSRRNSGLFNESTNLFDLSINKANSDDSSSSHDYLTNCEIGGIYRKKLIKSNKNNITNNDTNINNDIIINKNILSLNYNKTKNDLKSNKSIISLSDIDNEMLELGINKTDPLLSKELINNRLSPSKLSTSASSLTIINNKNNNKIETLTSLSIYYSVNTFELKQINKIWDDSDLFLRDTIDIPINIKNRDIILKEMQNNI